MSEIEKVTPSRRRPSTARKTAAEKPAAKIPAGARKPADHQSAKTDVAPPKTVPVKFGTDPKTKKDYVYQIDAERFDDLDYIDAMINLEQSKSDGERSTYAYIALKTMLTEEQLDQFKQREIEATGRARFSTAVQFFNVVMETLQKGNSRPSPAA